MALHELIYGIGSQRGVRKQGADEVDKLLNLKINQSPLLEEIRYISNGCLLYRANDPVSNQEVRLTITFTDQ